MVDGIILIQIHGCRHSGSSALRAFILCALVVEAHQMTSQTCIVDFVLRIENEENKVETGEQSVW